LSPDMPMSTSKHGSARAAPAALPHAYAWCWLLAPPPRRLPAVASLLSPSGLYVVSRFHVRRAQNKGSAPPTSRTKLPGLQCRWVFDRAPYIRSLHYSRCAALGPGLEQQLFRLCRTASRLRSVELCGVVGSADALVAQLAQCPALQELGRWLGCKRGSASGWISVEKPRLLLPSFPLCLS
jgi:hypothetical protein